MVAQRADGLIININNQLRAAGAVRVSEGKQAEGYSPLNQREAIKARARADGYLMDDADIYEDHARGHKITRKGYVAILAGVREGRYAAVYVYMLDRWGRDSLERQARGKEFDKLGVPLISIMEGVDTPGIVRAVRAELSEEESRRNAQRVIGNRERAAREGTHMGSTPYGYRRIYPAWDGAGRRPAGNLVPDPETAMVVRDLFDRYGSGEWSTRQLADDLNARGVPSPKVLDKRTGRRYQWTTGAVHDVLVNKSYAGVVGYNQRPTGYYLHADEDGADAFVADGKHDALVSPETFALVQRRLAEARTYKAVAHRTAHTHLVAGLMRCQDCGGLMVPMLNKTGGQMRCANRHHGARNPGGAACAGEGYRLDLATDALLSEVKRLRGRPWTSDAEERLAGDQVHLIAGLAHELEAAKETLRRHTRRITEMVDDPTPEERAVFDEVRREKSVQIRSLEAQIKEMSGDPLALPRLRALHARLRQTEIPDLVDRLRALGPSGEPALRDLLTGLVASATVVDRQPERRSTWLRVAVTWHPDVQELLDVGLLWLGPPVPPPAPAEPHVIARRERQARFRQRHPNRGRAR